MASVVWPDHMGVPNRCPPHPIRGTMRTESDPVREIIGDTAVDVGAGILLGTAS